MPSDIPTPLPAWAKTLVKYTNDSPPGFLWDLLEFVDETPAPEDLQWQRLNVHFDNLGSSEAHDDFWCTFDLANITGGHLDTSWTTSDYTTAEAKFDTCFTALLPRLHAKCKVVEYKWYARQFNPYSDPKPYADSGPPVRVTPKSMFGTGSYFTPPQVAISVTERTAWPHHWGRFYLPGIDGSGVGTDLQVTTAFLSAIAGAVGTLYDDLSAAELFPVVPTTQMNKSPNRGLLQVNKIQVDSIFDVQRRRRTHTARERAIHP
jgi:hypothetical protein